MKTLEVIIDLVRAMANFAGEMKLLMTAPVI